MPYASLLARTVVGIALIACTPHAEAADACAARGEVVAKLAQRFGETLRSPVWPSTGFVYIGKGPRGLDLRVRYFRGARLKKPKT